MKLAEKVIYLHESVINVVVKEKKSGNTLSIQDGSTFMKMLDKAGIKNKIGNNRFLDDYIKEYNKTYPENKAEIKLK